MMKNLYFLRYGYRYYGYSRYRTVLSDKIWQELEPEPKINNFGGSATLTVTVPVPVC